MKLAALWHVFKTAALDWQRHNATRLGAAIAYYAIFSIAPLLVVAIGIAGSVFGQNAAKGEVFDEVNRFLGSEPAAAPSKTWSVAQPDRVTAALPRF